MSALLRSHGMHHPVRHDAASEGAKRCAREPLRERALCKTEAACCPCEGGGAGGVSGGPGMAAMSPTRPHPCRGPHPWVGQRTQ